MKITELQFSAINKDFKHIEKKATADQLDMEEQKLREASKRLEGQFLSFMLKAMENTIPKEDNKSSNNLATMMFSSVMGKEVANMGGIGLADFIYNGLKERDLVDLNKLSEESQINPFLNFNLMDQNDE